MTKNVKIVCVGDESVGKTCMFLSYANNSFPCEYVSTDFGDYNATVLWENEHVSIGLWDTSGRDDMKQLRPLSYPETHVFLVCFSLVDRTSFKNAEKWYSEIQDHAPGVPIILVGTKIDLRNDRSEVEKLREKGETPVSRDEGEDLAKRLGCALTQYGLKEVFQGALECVLSPKKEKKRKKAKKGRNRFLLLDEPQSKIMHPEEALRECYERRRRKHIPAIEFNQKWLESKHPRNQESFTWKDYLKELDYDTSKPYVKKLREKSDEIRDRLEWHLKEEAVTHTSWNFFINRVQVLLHSYIEVWVTRRILIQIIILLVVLNYYTFVGIVVFLLIDTLFVFLVSHWCFCDMFCTMFKNLCFCIGFCEKCLENRKIINKETIKARGWCCRYRYRPFHESVFEYSLDLEYAYETFSWKFLKVFIAFVVLLVSTYFHYHYFERTTDIICYNVQPYVNETSGQVTEHYVIEYDGYAFYEFIPRIYTREVLWSGSARGILPLLNCDYAPGYGFLNYWKGILLGLVGILVMIIFGISAYDGPATVQYSRQLQKLRDCGVRFPKIPLSWGDVRRTRTRNYLQNVINCLNILRIRMLKNHERMKDFKIERLTCELSLMSKKHEMKEKILQRQLLFVEDLIPSTESDRLQAKEYNREKKIVEMEEQRLRVLREKQEEDIEIWKDPRNQIARESAYNHLRNDGMKSIESLSPLELGFLHYFFIDSLEDKNLELKETVSFNSRLIHYFLLWAIQRSSGMRIKIHNIWSFRPDGELIKVFKDYFKICFCCRDNFPTFTPVEEKSLAWYDHHIGLFSGGNRDMEAIVTSLNDPSETKEDELPKITMLYLLKNVCCVWGAARLFLLQVCTCCFCCVLPEHIFDAMLYTDLEKFRKKFSRRKDLKKMVQDKMDDEFAKDRKKLYNDTFLVEGLDKISEFLPGTDLNNEYHQFDAPRMMYCCCGVFDCLFLYLRYFWLLFFEEVSRWRETRVDEKKEKYGDHDKDYIIQAVNTKALCYYICKGLIDDITHFYAFLTTSTALMFIKAAVVLWIVLGALVLVCEYFTVMSNLFLKDIDISIPEDTLEGHEEYVLWSNHEDYDLLVDHLSDTSRWSVVDAIARFIIYFVLCMLSTLFLISVLSVLVCFSGDIEERIRSFSYRRIFRSSFKKRKYYENCGLEHLFTEFCLMDDFACGWCKVYQTILCCRKRDEKFTTERYRNEIDERKDKVLDVGAYDDCFPCFRSLLSRFDFLFWDIFCFIIVLMFVFFVLVTVVCIAISVILGVYFSVFSMFAIPMVLVIFSGCCCFGFGVLMICCVNCFLWCFCQVTSFCYFFCCRCCCYTAESVALKFQHLVTVDYDADWIVALFELVESLCCDCCLERCGIWELFCSLGIMAGFGCVHCPLSVPRARKNMILKKDCYLSLCITIVCCVLSFSLVVSWVFFGGLFFCFWLVLFGCVILILRLIFKYGVNKHFTPCVEKCLGKVCNMRKWGLYSILVCLRLHSPIHLNMEGDDELVEEGKGTKMIGKEKATGKEKGKLLEDENRQYRGTAKEIRKILINQDSDDDQIDLCYDLYCDDAQTDFDIRVHYEIYGTEEQQKEQEEKEQKQKLIDGKDREGKKKEEDHSQGEKKKTSKRRKHYEKELKRRYHKFDDDKEEVKKNYLWLRCLRCFCQCICDLLRKKPEEEDKGKEEKDVVIEEEEEDDDDDEEDEEEEEEEEGGGGGEEEEEEILERIVNSIDLESGRMDLGKKKKKKKKEKKDTKKKRLEGRTDKRFESKLLLYSNYMKNIVEDEKNLRQDLEQYVETKEDKEFYNEFKKQDYFENILFLLALEKYKSRAIRPHEKVLRQLALVEKNEEKRETYEKEKISQGGRWTLETVYRRKEFKEKEEHDLELRLTEHSERCCILINFSDDIQKLVGVREDILNLEKIECKMAGIKLEEKKLPLDLVFQRWFNCAECGLTGKRGICLSCANTCHSGHKPTESLLSPSRFKCSCQYSDFYKERKIEDAGKAGQPSLLKKKKGFLKSLSHNKEEDMNLLMDMEAKIPVKVRMIREDSLPFSLAPVEINELESLEEGGEEVKPSDDDGDEEEEDVVTSSKSEEEEKEKDEELAKEMEEEVEETEEEEEEEEEEFPQSEDFTRAFQQGVCTLKLTGREYHTQRWFSCDQCGLVRGYGMCLTCARRCHRGHFGVRESYGSPAHCFCDCGERDDCLCMDHEYVRKPKKKKKKVRRRRRKFVEEEHKAEEEKKNISEEVIEIKEEPEEPEEEESEEEEEEEEEENHVRKVIDREPTAKDFKKCVAEGVCTFKLTGREYYRQRWYSCAQCNLVMGNGCCESCFNECHKGHVGARESVWNSPARCFCDCCFRDSCKCIKKKFNPDGPKTEEEKEEEVPEEEEEEEEEGEEPEKEVLNEEEEEVKEEEEEDDDDDNRYLGSSSSSTSEGSVEMNMSHFDKVRRLRREMARRLERMRSRTEFFNHILEGVETTDTEGISSTEDERSGEDIEEDVKAKKKEEEEPEEEEDVVDEEEEEEEKTKTKIEAEPKVVSRSEEVVEIGREEEEEETTERERLKPIDIQKVLMKRRKRRKRRRSPASRAHWKRIKAEAKIKSIIEYERKKRCKLVAEKYKEIEDKLNPLKEQYKETEDKYEDEKKKAEDEIERLDGLRLELAEKIDRIRVEFRSGVRELRKRFKTKKPPEEFRVLCRQYRSDNAECQEEFKKAERDLDKESTKLEEMEKKHTEMKSNLEKLEEQKEKMEEFVLEVYKNKTKVERMNEKEKEIYQPVQEYPFDEHVKDVIRSCVEQGVCTARFKDAEHPHFLKRYPYLQKAYCCTVCSKRTLLCESCAKECHKDCGLKESKKKKKKKEKDSDDEETVIQNVHIAYDYEFHKRKPVFEEKGMDEEKKKSTACAHIDYTISEKEKKKKGKKKKGRKKKKDEEEELMEITTEDSQQQQQPKFFEVYCRFTCACHKLKKGKICKCIEKQYEVDEGTDKPMEDWKMKLTLDQKQQVYENLAEEFLTLRHNYLEEEGKKVLVDRRNTIDFKKKIRRLIDSQFERHLYMNVLEKSEQELELIDSRLAGDRKSGLFLPFMNPERVNVKKSIHKLVTTTKNNLERTFYDDYQEGADLCKYFLRFRLYGMKRHPLPKTRLERMVSPIETTIEIIKRSWERISLNWKSLKEKMKDDFKFWGKTIDSLIPPPVRKSAKVQQDPNAVNNNNNNEVEEKKKEKDESDLRLDENKKKARKNYIELENLLRKEGVDMLSLNRIKTRYKKARINKHYQKQKDREAMNDLKLVSNHIWKISEHEKMSKKKQKQKKQQQKKNNTIDEDEDMMMMIDAKNDPFRDLAMSRIEKRDFEREREYDNFLSLKEVRRAMKDMWDEERKIREYRTNRWEQIDIKRRDMLIKWGKERRKGKKKTVMGPGQQIFNDENDNDENVIHIKKREEEEEEGEEEDEV